MLLLLLLVRALTNKGRQTIKSTAYETGCEHGGDCSPDFEGHVSQLLTAVPSSEDAAAASLHLPELPQKLGQSAG